MTGTMKTSSIYDDDEPVTWQPGNTAGNGVLEFSARCEYPALPNAVARDGFAVMVHVRAPALSPAEARRAPLDLVAVLDVSDADGTPSGAAAKLAQVKRAVAFAADRLGPRDRLSVVAALSGDARRVTPLSRMTADGKAAAKRAVEALVFASGGSTSTAVRAALDEAAKVLERRRHRNGVAGVIFLSDGRRDYTASDSCVLLPKFFQHNGGGWRRAPVHTFGLGPNVDAAAMHKIAEATGGTFSFVEDQGSLQDALAQCVAGLRSVTAQDVWIEVETFSPGVRMTAVKSGRYKSSVEGDPHSGYEATVNAGELCADEERRFLFFLDVPGVDDAGDSVTLVRTRCSYFDVATRQPVHVDFAETCAGILSRDDEAAAGTARRVEVERELLRVAAAEDMALAREAAERGDYEEAARVLDARRELLGRSAPALAGDAVCAAVAAELHELRQRVSDEREYRKTGRACLLAAMSSHAQQRGSSFRLYRPLSSGPGQFGWAGSSVFATPAMRKMEKLSEMLRRQQEARPPPLPEIGSKSVRPRTRLEARLASVVPRLSMLSRYRRLLVKR